jgi:hypothetical protein
VSAASRTPGGGGGGGEGEGGILLLLQPSRQATAVAADAASGRGRGSRSGGSHVRTRALMHCRQHPPGIGGGGGMSSGGPRRVIFTWICCPSFTSCGMVKETGTSCGFWPFGTSPCAGRRVSARVPARCEAASRTGSPNYACLSTQLAAPVPPTLPLAPHANEMASAARTTVTFAFCGTPRGAFGLGPGTTIVPMVHLGAASAAAASFASWISLRCFFEDMAPCRTPTVVLCHG